MFFYHYYLILNDPNHFIMNNQNHEYIPDEDLLYRRVHANWISENGISPGFFGDSDLSVDWSKYSTPYESKKRATNPLRNGVISFVVGKVRKIPNQKITHAPSLYPQVNKAHSLISGDKSDPEIRLLFKRLYVWEIQL